MKDKAVFALLLFLIVSAFTLTAFGVKRQSSLNAKQQAQVKFLCSTSASLATVLQNAADQIENSFENGTYQRLVKQGVATPANLRAARDTLHSYRAQIAVLKNPDSPCKTHG